MKKEIAIMFTLILAAGTFTACTAEEKANNDIRTSVVSKTADVSVSETTFVSNTTSKIETTVTAETTVNPTVSQETKSLKTDTKSEEKADSGQNPLVVSATEPTQAKQGSIPKDTEQKTKATKEKPTQKATEKPTEKITQPPTEKKSVDVTSAVNSAISYGKQLGMKYDSSLNTGNASWFSPTNASYYDDTQSLIADCYADIEYVAHYYKNDGIVPSDLSFNVVAESNKIYVVYC